MINISNKEHFREVIRFANKIGGDSKKSLRRCIGTLNRMKRNSYSDMDLYIYPDFVKYSFGWHFGKYEIVKDENFDKIERLVKSGLNGGVILHGYEETYSVELVGEKYPHWSIHT